jgi:hypothetical protein
MVFSFNWKGSNYTAGAKFTCGAALTSITPKARIDMRRLEDLVPAGIVLTTINDHVAEKGTK